MILDDIKEKVLVLDGAMGTELEKRGVNVNDPLWSAAALLDEETRPVVKDIHLDYLRSGAHLLLTSTYQLSLRGLLERNLDGVKNTSDCAKSFALSVDSASAAVEEFGSMRPIYIGGSIGPFGAYLADGSEYTGQYGNAGFDELREFHEFRLKELMNNEKVDFIAFETLPSFLEVKALVALLEGYGNNLKPFYLSLNIPKNPQEMADGTPIEDFVRFLATKTSLHSQLLGVGANCVKLLDSCTILQALRITIDETTLKGLALVMYPNSGEIYDGSAKTWALGENCDRSLSDLNKEWVRQGARIVGGCCRMGPREITEISASSEK